MNNVTLTRRMLYDLVWSQPLTMLAKKYEISDVGLRKICIRMNIPLPKIGHWQKLKAGKRVSFIELPSPESEAKVILSEISSLENRKEYPWTKLQKEIENDPRLNLIVPDRLHNPDDLIIEARRILSDRETKRWQFSILKIVVEPKTLRRALLFMDTFIKLLRSRGHDIEVDQDATYAVLKGVRVKIQLRERSRIVKNPEGKWPSRDFIPTGILVLLSDDYCHSEWKDGKRRLEDQLSSILAKLETKVNELHEIWRQNRIREEEENRLMEILREKEARMKKELRDFKSLLNKSLRWQQVRVLRDFIADTVAQANGDKGSSIDLSNWVDWATKKADWFDPHVEAEDILMAEVDKESLTLKAK